MPLTPGSTPEGDARFGQPLTTAVDLHGLGAPPDLQRGLETLRDHIRAGREGAVRSLFVGAPGSGQALAAAALGKAVGMAVFRIDLSTVVSRHIGETEKNLDRIFGAAGNADVILFFDEADALFGKRTEVHDAHDRYANVETGYLLQRLEAHAGPAIFATRSRADIDPAFVRRLRHVLHFAAPLHPPPGSKAGSEP
jgi:SpoVK/Ycf46/Vps4 family AAA+-type ATPase